MAERRMRAGRKQETTHPRQVRLPDWGLPPAASRRLPLGVAVAVLTVVLAGAVAATAGPLSAVVAVVALWLAVGLASLLQARDVVRRLGARPAEDPRLYNIVAGMALKLGRPMPRLLLAEGAPNAFAIPDGRAGRIVVTRSMLEAARRTELEALAAGALVRLSRSGWELGVATVLRPLAPLAAPLVDLDADVVSAAATRYPPALVAIVERAEPPPRFAAPWALVSSPPWGRRPEERLKLLRDL